MRPSTSKRKATNFPVRWQPYAELTAAAAVACGGGGEASLHTSLLGGGRRDGIVERNLLSQFKGEANQQQVITKDRAEPSLALSLRVGSQEELPQPLNPLRYAPTRQSPSFLRAGSSVPPQTYAPGSPPAPGAGLAPAPAPAPARHLRSNSVQLPLGAVGATPPEPEPRCGACSLCHDRVAAADLLKKVSDDLDRRVALLRQELIAEVSKQVLQLHAAATAAATGVPLPFPAAFSAAAGLPQPQPCGGGGAWRRCPACVARPGRVVLKPYEHLCLCAQCSEESRLCLHCHCSCSSTWTGAVVEAAAAAAARGRGRGGSLPPWP